MVEPYLRQSPLASLHIQGETTLPSTADYQLLEHPYRGLINIRGDIQDAKFGAAIKKATRTDLPKQPNAVSGTAKGTHIIWLGPDEWLVVTKPGGEERMVSSLTKSLDGLHASVTDISESRTVIGLSGTRALDILEKGCSLDLYPQVFTVGQCAQTRLSRANVILHHTGIAKAKDVSFYELYVLRSFAGYLWQWILDAGKEFE